MAVLYMRVSCMTWVALWFGTVEGFFRSSRLCWAAFPSMNHSSTSCCGEPIGSRPGCVGCCSRALVSLYFLPLDAPPTVDKRQKHPQRP
jgi:hypothetical protein